MNLKLILPNRVIPVTAQVEAGRLTITGDGVWFQLEGLSLDHVLHGGEPGIIREEREPRDFTTRLTLTDLDPALPATKLKEMLIEHFLAIGFTDEATDIMRDWEAITKRKYQPTANGPDSQLTQDLAAVEPIRDELVQDGELVWGGQSRIAEALGIPNAGGYRARVLTVRDALLEKEAA